MKIISLLIFLILVFPTMAQAKPDQKAFEQMVSSFRQYPGDDGLREKIIRAALQIKPKPAIPKEARNFMIRGQAAAEMAKTTEDFTVAAGEFQKAVNVAPWFADAYYNLAMVQERAEQFGQAAKSLKWYLLAAPKAADAGKVQDLIVKLEYKQERTTQAKSGAEAKWAKIESLLGKWDYELNFYGQKFTGTLTMTLEGNTIEIKGPNSRDDRDRGAPVDVANTADPLQSPISVIRGTLQGPDIAGIKWQAYKHDFFNGECSYKAGFVDIFVSISPDQKEMQFSYPAVWKSRANMSSPLSCNEHSFEYTLRHR
jgi:tetratricopeptide (TPR) repeat protein